MLIVYFLFAHAFLPMRLKELRVAIGNQKYPDKVLTIGKSDLIHKDFKMLEVAKLNKGHLKNQIFKMQEAWNGGIVLKTQEQLRSFRHFDTLKLKAFSDLPNHTRLYLIKTETKYPYTFQLVSGKECLDAIEGFDKGKIYVKFNECSNSDSQIWGAFTEDQARSYMKMSTISLDRDESDVKRFIDEIHRKSFREINK